MLIPLIILDNIDGISIKMMLDREKKHIFFTANSIKKMLKVGPGPGRVTIYNL